MPLLLDTHVIVWLVEGTAEVPVTVRSVIEEAARTEDVLVSAISFWEIALLVSRRRLALSEPVLRWAEMVVVKPGIRLTPFTVDIAVDSVNLPGRLHADPADRFLVAAAREVGATLVTRDRRLLAYGAAGHVATLAA